MPEQLEIPASPRDLGLPFDEWRPGQREIIGGLVDWYLNGTEKYFFLEAPTGIGKSLIAGGVTSLLHEEGASVRAIISTISKSLQTQYADGTLPDAAIAWGRGNHDCLILPAGADPGDAPCTYGHRCDRRGDCTYYVERDGAAVAPLAVLNTAFLLTCLRYVKASESLLEDIPIDPAFYGQREYGYKLFEGASLMIHDEAHLLEGAIRNSVEMRFYYSFFDEIGHRLPRVADYNAWSAWAEAVLPVLNDMSDDYKREAVRAAKQGQVPGPEFAAGKRAVGYASQVSMFFYTVLPLAPNIDLSNAGYALIRPIWAAPFAQSALFNKAKKHLLMSATIIHPDYMARGLGIEPGEYRYASLPSPFHPMLRPLIDVAKTSVSAKTTKETFKRLVVDVMDDLLDQHPNDKGIVHAVSYARAQDILAMSRHRGRMITHGSGVKGGKEAAIAAYVDATFPAILVSPSVGVGEDFGKDDGCRVQFFVKYPFPSLGDPIVRARIEDEPDSAWKEADMAFVQAVGRGMRSPTDHCTNYLLDSGARWRLGKLPQWFKDSIIVRK